MSRSSTAPAGSRQHSSAAAPPMPHSQSYGAPPAPPHAASESKPVGMLGQIAANATSVAAGAGGGHGISRMLWGGSSDAAAPVQEPVQAQPVNSQYQPEAMNCDLASKSEFCVSFCDKEVRLNVLQVLLNASSARRSTARASGISSNSKLYVLSFLLFASDR